MVDVVGDGDPGTMEFYLQEMGRIHNRPKKCSLCESNEIDSRVISDKYPKNMRNGRAIVKRLITYLVDCRECGESSETIRYINKVP